MRKALLVVGLVLLWPSGASAAMTDRCQAPDRFEPMFFTCRHSFVATANPQEFQALGQGWRSYAARWITESGTQFLATGGHRPWCHLYGHYSDLKVTENSCNGNLIVKVKSTGPPTRVTFSWEVLR